MIHTCYERMSSEQLGDLFHSAYWDSPGMTLDDKVSACQEVVNRDALSHGAQPCEVVAEHMTGTTFGYYSNADGRIHVNRNVLDKGVTVDENGNATPYSGSNAETLDTLFHENYHAYAAQLTEALENMDSGLVYNHTIVEDAVNRGIDIDAVRAADTIYVSSDTSFDVYRVQPSERAAFNAGERGAAVTFASSQARLGNDPGYQAYVGRLANADSFRAAMANLREVTGDKDFDKTLEEQAKDIYFSDHKQDSEFVHGTTESRVMARSILETTQGAQLTNELAQYGIHNTHSSDILVAQATQNVNAFQTVGVASLTPENQNDSQSAKATTHMTEIATQAASEATHAQAQGGNTEETSSAESQTGNTANTAAEAPGNMPAGDATELGMSNAANGLNSDHEDIVGLVPAAAGTATVENESVNGETSAEDVSASGEYVASSKGAFSASDDDGEFAGDVTDVGGSASTGGDSSTSDSGGNWDDDTDSMSDA